MDKNGKLVFARAAEAANRAIGGVAAFTDFTDPAKAKRVYDEYIGDVKARIYGGMALSERAVVGFCPDFADAEEALSDERFPITRIKITADSNKLTHKDYLGAMAAVVGRNKIGDIIAGKDAAFAFVKTEVAEILSACLREVGRYAVSCEIVDEVEFDGVSAPKVKTAFVHSLRLDGVLAKCFGLSRGEAQTAVKAEKVFVNWEIVTGVHANVKESDMITARGSGRVQITSVETTSKERFKLEYLSWR
jgi:RNA-binding protein YlmH